MNKMLAAVMICFSTLANAVDNPTVVIGSEQYSQSECLNKTIDDCINNICMNSEDTNCQENCNQDAQDKCQEAEEGD
ncbi:hypothetical protein ACFORL_02695 [Legionella dresdenensis]|uniref:Uncharacterized protein n=1 Tax=Legionella dresdenensis TaxID=450200 RepID=A0ABV8CCE7_9GAMM